MNWEMIGAIGEVGGAADISKLTEAEYRIFSMFFDRQMFNFETIISAYEEGAYDPNLFESLRGLFTSLINSSGGQRWLEKGGFPPTERAKNYLGIT